MTRPARSLDHLSDEALRAGLEFFGSPRLREYYTGLLSEFRDELKKRETRGASQATRCDWCGRVRSLRQYTHADGSLIWSCTGCMDDNDCAHQYEERT